MAVREITLTSEQACSAQAIQRVIDGLGPSGGRVILPEMDLVLDRGVELCSNVELVGQGASTRLHMAPSRIYPLSGYHNYGMMDVPLQYTEGLEAGMTVAIRDDRQGGFFETLARITWIDGTWVGLDCGLHSDYRAADHPVLVTSYPLVYGLDVHDVALRNLSLDGHRSEQPAGIGACRGAAVYFLRCHRVEVSDVEETSFAGEGIGFQMSSDVRILSCRVKDNAGNGFHPGAGSTGAYFEGCTAQDNGRAGFYFCVRANHITVRGCIFRRNVDCGVSVGTRDCYNLVERCSMADNAGPGILFRGMPKPVEVHSCRVARCHITGNAVASGNGQIDVRGDAHDLSIVGNHISGSPDRESAGIYLSPSVESVWLDDNHIEGCFPAVVREAARAEYDPGFACGVNAVAPVHYRHLGVQMSAE